MHHFVKFAPLYFMVDICNRQPVDNSFSNGCHKTRSFHWRALFGTRSLSEPVDYICQQFA